MDWETIGICVFFYLLLTFVAMIADQNIPPGGKVN